MISGVCFYGNAAAPTWLSEISSPEELMDMSDAVLFLGETNIGKDLIRLVLRKSKHVYFKTIPNLQSSEVKELIDLEKEAGIVTFIFNPLSYIPFFESFQQRNENPFLINIRTCFDGENLKTSNELLLLVTALCKLAQSNYKKLDVIGLGEQTNQLTIDLRIEFNNGSVIHLTIAHEKSNGFCEIFDQRGSTRFEFKTSLYSIHPRINHETLAIANFIGQALNQEKKLGSFDNLLNGVQILNEIKEHLRFSEISF